MVSLPAGANHAQCCKLASGSSAVQCIANAAAVASLAGAGALLERPPSGVRLRGAVVAEASDEVFLASPTAGRTPAKRKVASPAPIFLFSLYICAAVSATVQ